MGKICEQFEAETPTDSEATQKARFETVLDLMQQVRPPSAISPLVLSGWVFGGGYIWEGGHIAKPRWKRGHKRGRIVWSSGESRETIAQILLFSCCIVFWVFLCLMFLCSYFPATGFGPSSKRAGWGDGEYIFS